MYLCAYNNKECNMLYMKNKECNALYMKNESCNVQK